MSNDSILVRHVLECISRIEEDASEGRDAFFASRRIQDAVVRNLQIMSESVQRLSPEARDLASEVDWRSLAAFRNVLVHGYLGLDMERIWKIVEEDVPHLKRSMVELSDRIGGS